MGLDNEIALLIAVGILLPTSSFGFQYIFSRIAGTHGYFLQRTKMYFADWILVPFTVLALLTVSIRHVLLLIPVGLLVSYIGHRMWAKNKFYKKSILHFFTPDYRRLSHAGLIHLLYTGFQIALITTFIFTAPISPLVNYASLVLIFFAFSILQSSFAMHKKILESDLVIVITISALALAKLIFQIPYTSSLGL